MEIGLFILLNAVLLIRPEEMLPAIAGMRLYLITIILLTFISLPKLLHLLNPNQLQKRPMVVAILLFHVMFWMSMIMRGNFDKAIESGGEFAKTLLYSLLLASILDTPRRIDIFLGWLVVFSTLAASIALLDFHEYIRIEAIQHPFQWWVNPESGETVMVYRMASAGLFGDPNDLSLATVVGLCSSFYQIVCSKSAFQKLLWCLPIPVLVFAFTQTQSRGGMLAMLAAITGLAYSRFGLRRCLPLLVVAVPALLLGIGGRQANLTGGDTAWERMLLWSYGLSEVTRGPMNLLFGIGAEEYLNFMGAVAHNSFIHSYVELGIIGGGCFLYLFYFPAMMLRTPPYAGAGAGDWTAKLRPIIMALLAGYAGGAYSLSRCYVLPTFMLLGIIEAYLAQRPDFRSGEHAVSSLWFQKFIFMAVLGFIGLKLMTQFLMAGL
jgi:putative inorganic carbon (hco3(-)) transporter